MAAILSGSQSVNSMRLGETCALGHHQMMSYRLLSNHNIVIHIQDNAFEYVIYELVNVKTNHVDMVDGATESFA